MFYRESLARREFLALLEIKMEDLTRIFKDKNIAKDVSISFKLFLMGPI